MLFNSFKVTSLLALTSIADGMAFKHKRSAETGLTLFAYGVGRGLPLIYADG